jgi:putative transposase
MLNSLTHPQSALVIGKNDGWKQKANIGKANTQKFVVIPYKRLIEMLTYTKSVE